MKTNKSILSIYLEKDIEDVKLLGELTELTRHLSTKDLITKYPMIHELKHNLKKEI